MGKKLPSNVCFIVLASHTLLSPQSCHAYPAPLSQRNITVSYKEEKRKEGGGKETFFKVEWKCNSGFPASLSKINK